MNTLTPDETAIMHDVGTLMVRTMALAAMKRDAVRIDSRDMLGRPRHVRVNVNADPDDVPLILGGRGTNAKTVRELAAMACPAGAYIDLHLVTAAESGERNPRDFGDASELEAALAREIAEVVASWHVALGDDPPVVRYEATPRCDIWLVQGRNIPGSAMGSLRRLIGWACKVRGRNGFVEWESPR